MLCGTYVRARADFGETRQGIKVAELRGGSSLDKDESTGYHHMQTGLGDSQDIEVNYRRTSSMTPSFLTGD